MRAEHLDRDTLTMAGLCFDDPHSDPAPALLVHDTNGNICRCGAYVQILEAIQAVVEASEATLLACHGRLRVITHLAI
jgi:xanthine dehydrogenase iron-sulfur cluster and FAD-binding subunit A